MCDMIEKLKLERKYPFNFMKIDDYSVLDKVEGRYICPICYRSRKFFCYSCYVPGEKLREFLPHVHIPVKIDIIKHKKEIDGKSTAIHAAILAHDNVKIYTYPDIPDYSDEEGVVLIFPSANSATVGQLFGKDSRLQTENNYGMPKGFNMGTLLTRRMEEISTDDKLEKDYKYTFSNLPIKKAVFIDSTWKQCRSIYKDERIRKLQPVIFQNRISQFWRHQKGSPRWYLATIESIHQFLLEVHANAWGLSSNYRGLDNLEICESFYKSIRLVDSNENSQGREDPYCGQYDNLLYFFANMYDLIHKYYDHNLLKSYRRPI